VLSAHFQSYIQAFEKLQLDIATSNDLIGVDTRSTGLFSRSKEPLKNRCAVFALGERIQIIKVFIIYPVIIFFQTIEHDLANSLVPRSLDIFLYFLSLTWRYYIARVC